MKLFGAVLLFVLLDVAFSAVDSDLVQNLPGLIFQTNFKTYSGYLKTSDTKMLHYW